MASRRRQARGKQQHAEGMHGDRTHEALIEQLHNGLPAPADPTPAGASKSAPHREAAEGHRESDELAAHLPGPDGRHRLDEDRQQHDEADKNSEKTRAARKGSASSRTEPERPTRRGSRSK